MKTRFLVLTTIVMAAGLAVEAAGAGPAGVDPGKLRAIVDLLVKFDVNGNDALDPAERKTLEAFVVQRHGQAGAVVLDAVLAAADTDGDGRITKAEGEAAAKKAPAAASRAKKRTVMVAMSDGVRLATDVYVPPGKGRFPAVLLRTPYGKGKRASGYVAQEHAFVVQDMRGRFDSEGENLPFIGCGWVKHRDGADTVAWIRRQTWCNGKVATMGGSAGGVTQCLLAGAAPEGLAFQHINVAAASLYHHAAYVGGAFRKSQVEGWVKGNRFDAKALRLFAAHPTYDEFWHGFDSTRRHGVMTAPAVHVGGWFDTFAQGTIDAFVGRQYSGGPGAKGAQKLVMGPWTHGRTSGELRFPNAGMPSKYGARPLLAHYLLGKDNGAEKLPAVAYYVMGDTAEADAPGNEWRYADRWPIPCEPTPYYFHADGRLSAEKPGVLAGRPAVRTYMFDPAKPCPTVGGCNLVLPAGPRNQNRIEGRKDVLLFTTDPLAAPLEVTGRLRAKIFVSCSAVDTDLSVRFCDVYPNGKSYLMAEGMLRLRYREGLDAVKLMTPGQVHEVDVACWATSVVVNRGHRIRVTVTSSNYPRFDVNGGTGRPYRDGAKAVKQTNRIYCDGAYPSHILLPVIPARKRTRMSQMGTNPTKK